MIRHPLESIQNNWCCPKFRYRSLLMDRPAREIWAPLAGW